MPVVADKATGRTGLWREEAGYADLFAKRVRPNPRLAPREVYDANARRWQQEWPSLVVHPWPSAV